MRLLIANLDCEAAFAEAAGVSRYHLSQPVARRIAALGALLGALGRVDDALWLPAELDPARLHPSLPQRLRSGPLSPAESASAVLAWGETRDTAALRARLRRVRAPARAAAIPAPTPPTPTPELPVTPPEPAWQRRLWTLAADAAANAEASWRVNDRRFCVPLQESLGCRLPGAALIDSLDELRQHLAELATAGALSDDDAWVLKAPFSASGRLRVRRRGADISPDIATRIERLLARFGTLCFEPWVTRERDLGCLGLVTGADAWEIFPPHGLECDRAGVFRGIEVHAAAAAAATADADDTPWLQPEHARALQRAADHAASALASAGYRGAFGIDAFLYRPPDADAGAALRLQPLCEINARLSFGFVAHALAAGTGAERLWLRVGEDLPDALPDARLLPLVRAGSEGIAAWAEIWNSPGR